MVTPPSIGGRSRIDWDLGRRFEARVLAIADGSPVLIRFGSTHGRNRLDYSALVAGCLGCDGRVPITTDTEEVTGRDR